MASLADVHALPGFVAIDALTVLKGERPGASLQLTDGYLAGQRTVLEAVDLPGSADERIEICRESRRILEDIHIDIGSLTEQNLWEASIRFRRLLRQLPEVRYLKRHYPETCFVVPEWLRTPSEVQYGTRVYFFADDAPEPKSVLEENIRAVLDDSQGSFERYQGSLHGYPECCIDYYQEATRSPDAAPPESRSIAPLDEHVREDRLERGSPLSSSFDETLQGFFNDPQSYAFFAHEFYPEPGCETARQNGVEIYETLAEILPESVVRDYFRFNFGWSYLMARAVRRDDETPEPGRFGREHALLYLPLRSALDLY